MTRTSGTIDMDFLLDFFYEAVFESMEGKDYKSPASFVPEYDASRVEVVRANDESNDKSIYSVASKTIGVKVQKAVDEEVSALLDDSSCFAYDDEELEEDSVVIDKTASGGAIDRDFLLNFFFEAVFESMEGRDYKSLASSVPVITASGQLQSVKSGVNVQKAIAEKKEVSANIDHMLSRYLDDQDDMVAYDASRVEVVRANDESNDKSIYSVASKTIGVKVQKAIDEEVCANIPDKVQTIDGPLPRKTDEIWDSEYAAFTFSPLKMEQKPYIETGLPHTFVPPPSASLSSSWCRTSLEVHTFDSDSDYRNPYLPCIHIWEHTCLDTRWAMVGTFLTILCAFIEPSAYRGGWVAWLIISFLAIVGVIILCSLIRHRGIIISYVDALFWAGHLSMRIVALFIDYEWRVETSVLVVAISVLCLAFHMYRDLHGPIVDHDDIV